MAGFDPAAPVEDGVFDPEEVYGRFPAGRASRPESQRARSERKRGLSVPALVCPTLVISGDDFPDERGRDLAAVYGAEHLSLPGLDHWQLVTEQRAIDACAAFLDLSR